MASPPTPSPPPRLPVRAATMAAAVAADGQRTCAQTCRSVGVLTRLRPIGDSSGRAAVPAGQYSPPQITSSMLLHAILHPSRLMLSRPPACRASGGGANSPAGLVPVFRLLVVCSQPPCGAAKARAAEPRRRRPGSAAAQPAEAVAARRAMHTAAARRAGARRGKGGKREGEAVRTEDGCAREGGPLKRSSSKPRNRGLCRSMSMPC